MNAVEKYKQKLQVEEEAEMAYMRAKSQVADAAAELIVETTIALAELFGEKDLYEVRLDGTFLILTVYYSNLDLDDIIEIMDICDFKLESKNLHIASQGSKCEYKFVLAGRAPTNSCWCGSGSSC